VGTNDGGHGTPKPPKSS